MRLRSLGFSLVAVVSLVGLARTARAADEEPPAEAAAPSPRAIDGVLTLALGVMREKGAHLDSSSEDYAGFQMAFRYRASPRFAVGALASHVLGGKEIFSRTAGELSLHPVRTRFFDLWTAAELGLAFTTINADRNTVVADGDCRVDPCGGGEPRFTKEQMRTRLGPEAGIGAGADVYLVPYVSLGIEARVLGVIFDQAPAPGLTSGPSPSAFAGLSLGAHVPFF